jgi:Acetyltransferase (GNAT) domain
MRIVKISPFDPRWANFVSSQPQAFIYHHPFWTRVIHQAYGHHHISLAAETPDGQIIGVLPLMRTWGISTGVRVVSLPHTPVAGPLAGSPEIASQLVSAAVALTRSIPGATLQLKTPSILHAAVEDVKTYPWQSTFTLQIPSLPEEIRFGDARHRHRILWAVRRGERLGIQVVEAQSVAQLHEWYQLYLYTMRDKAVPPRPFRFFLAAWNMLRPAGWMRLLLAVHGTHQLVAGSLLFMFGDTLFYAFNGRRVQELWLRPNDMLVWRAICDAQAAGHRTLDFGEVEADDQGLAAFKRKWGAKECQLWRHYYPAQREPELSRILRNGTIQRTLTETWRRLPLRATGVLGRWIYSYL